FLERLPELGEFGFDFIGRSLGLNRLLQCICIRIVPSKSIWTIVASISIVAAAPAAAAESAKAAAEPGIALGSHYFVDALLDDFPLVVTLNFQTFFVIIHHPLAELLRIEVSRPLRGHIA